MFNFYKYQSLGNDYVLFDWLGKTINNVDNVIQSDNWSTVVKHLCDRHFGIGSDGVLVIRKNLLKQIEAVMFNADGSLGYKCLNGLRCVAHYLVGEKKFPCDLEIFMGDKLMQCSVKDEIVINVGKVDYQGQHKLSLADSVLTGHIVSAGNPHFVIQQQIDLSWLQTNGACIEQHSDFPNRTNVEFVWPIDESNNYKILVHERGCGITLACGSGAAAVMRTLYELRKVKNNEKIMLNMQGGTLESYIDNNNDVIQRASATLVFQGIINEAILWPE
jgi:diaminopimelate epimerase